MTIVQTKLAELLARQTLQEKFILWDKLDDTLKREFLDKADEIINFIAMAIKDLGFKGR